MQNYKKLSDEELLNLIPQDNDALDELMIRYKEPVRKKARTMFLIGGEQEDLIQEGMIGLLQAIRTYDCDKGAGFSHYADVCVASKMYQAIESSTRLKHIPLNSYISLYEQISNDIDGSEFLMDVLVGGDEQNPENLLIDLENVERFDTALEKELSGTESEVLNLMLSGLSYTQIAEILNKTPKQIDNTIQRIRSKVRKLI